MRMRLVLKGRPREGVLNPAGLRIVHATREEGVALLEGGLDAPRPVGVGHALLVEGLDST